MSSTRPHDAMPRARDPGLQGERTALAWQRTSLAVLANGLLAMRSASVARSVDVVAEWSFHSEHAQSRTNPCCIAYFTNSLFVLN